MRQVSFGLTPEDKEIFLEPVFTLMYYLGFTYSEAMTLPIWQRAWFIQRINTEIETSQGRSKAAHANDPQTRALTGATRTESPARLRRFT